MIESKDKKLIQDLIAENQTGDAILQFRTALETAGMKGKWLSELLSISARFKGLVEEKNQGVLFAEQEEVLRNRIHADLLNLLERAGTERLRQPIEKAAAKAPAEKKPRRSPSKKVASYPLSSPKTSPATQSPDTQKGTARSSAWFAWLLVAGAGLLVYFLLSGGSAKVSQLSVCTMEAVDAGHCCMQNQTLIPQAKSGGLYVSLSLSGKQADPLIAGHVYFKNGGLVNTLPLQLTRESASACYSGLMLMPQGSAWSPGSYVLEIMVNNKAAASREFSVSY